MNQYRQLTEQEIDLLESNSCWSEDWTRVLVAEDFRANYFHRVMFYGDIRLGNFEKNVEVSKGFVKHSGINNATLRNVSVGDNCLIENIGNYINNYKLPELNNTVTAALNTANLASTVWLSQFGVREAVWTEEKNYDPIVKPYLSVNEYY